MTDKELIQALKHCGDPDEATCYGCPARKVCRENPGLPIDRMAADRLEALLAENERLNIELQAMRNAANGYKKMVPQWVSVSERLPHFNQPYIVTACDENAPYGEGIWYSTVVVVAEYYNGCWSWDDGSTEYDLTGIVTHWMPLPEPPSTEGVE